MAEQTGISWADSTANFWIGCQKVSPACDHCYAEELMDTRYGRVEWGGERVRCAQGWADVRKWQRAAATNDNRDPRLGRRRRIFVNSLADFFDNHRSVVWRDEAWDLIRQSPGLIFMLLTKRPQNIAKMLPPFWDEIAERVWLLTTVENQEEAERRVPALLASCVYKTRPAVFGLSCEPMLGPVDLRTIELRHTGQRPNDLSNKLGDYIQPLTGNFTDSPTINWVICGGESGKEARPMHPAWPRQLRDQCAAARVAFHFKQWGEWAPHRPRPGGDLGGDVRAGRVTTVHPTGQTEEEVFHQTGGRNTIPGTTYVGRVGKARAGHLLDGVEHMGVPDVV